MAERQREKTWRPEGGDGGGRHVTLCLVEVRRDKAAPACGPSARLAQSLKYQRCYLSVLTELVLNTELLCPRSASSTGDIKRSNSTWSISHFEMAEASSQQAGPFAQHLCSMLNTAERGKAGGICPRSAYTQATDENHSLMSFAFMDRAQNGRCTAVHDHSLIRRAGLCHCFFAPAPPS